MGGGSPISPLIIIMYTYMYTYARGDGGESISFPPHFFRYSSEGKKENLSGFSSFPPLPCPPFDQLFPVRGSEKQAVSREKEIRSLRRSQGRDRLRLRGEGPTFPSSSIVWSRWQDGIRSQCCAVSADPGRKMTECTEDRTLFFVLAIS